MEIAIERVQNEKEYIVRVNGRFTITTTWAEDEADVKVWVQLIRKIYRGKAKRRRRIVSLLADRSINYANGRSMYFLKGKRRDEPFELLQICVENHCLLCKLNADSVSWGEKFNPKVLKDFLHENGVTVVGVGVDYLRKRMEKDHGWVLPKLVELRDLAAAHARKARTTTAAKTIIDFRRFGIAKLAREVLGEEMELVKPTKLTWWAQPSWTIPRFLTDGIWSSMPLPRPFLLPKPVLS